MSLLLRRLRLDPTATEGGGGTTATPTPTPSPTPPPTVPLAVDEYQRLRGIETQLAQFQAAKDAEIAAKEAERIKALADKGQVDQALEESRKAYEARLNESTAKYADLERQVFNERKGAVIVGAFAGRSFVGQTAEEQARTASQVRTLLEGQFETVRDATGSLVVRDKVTGRPAADVIRETLDSPAFAHFLAPKGGTGTGGGAADRTAKQEEGKEEDGPKPGSLEWHAAQFKAKQEKYRAKGLKPIVR